MNTQYLGNHAEPVRDISKLTEGDVLVIGRGTNGFIALAVPGKENIEITNIDGIVSYDFINIPIYAARLKDCGKEIDEDEVRIDNVHLDGHLDIDLLGAVFRPTKGSMLRKTIEDKLGLKEAEEKDVA